MCACGDIGKERADQVLVRVPLRLDPGSKSFQKNVAPKMTLLGDDYKASGVEDEAARIRAGDVVGVLKDVNQCCFEHQREGVRRMVCRVIRVCSIGFFISLMFVAFLRSLARPL
jgi:nuclear pore complex protein Nup85